MVRFLLLILTFFLVQNTIAQQEEQKVLFSEALAMHLPKYEKKAKDAYFYRDYERARQLFDSLTEQKLSGSYLDNFQVYKLNGKPVSLYDFNKPVYLITYASWCVTTKGEIPALNQLAEKYRDQIEFVILFWDDQRTARKAGKAYSDAIKVVYVDELKNQDPFIIKNLKHSLGLPTTFLLDSNKKIIDIRRGVYHHYQKNYERSLDENYESIYNGIVELLLGEKNYNQRQDPVAVEINPERLNSAVNYFNSL